MRLLDYEEAQNTFNLRFYRWALADAEREYSNGFPNIMAVRSEVSELFLRFLDGLQSRERDLLCTALVKRFHLEAVRTSGESLSISERNIIDRYLSASGEPQDKPRFQPPPSKIIRDSARAALSTALGAAAESRGPDELRFRTALGTFGVYTWVDTGGTHRQLGYHHTVLAGGVPLRDWISLFSWLGIASQTDWTCLDAADVKSATTCLANLSAHFLAALPGFLEGLG